MEFDELRRERKELNDLVRLHEASLWRFKPEKHAWFRLTSMEAPDDRDLRHLSSSASCLESLADLPDHLRQRDDAAVANEFANTALKAPEKRWESEKAARIYCRVRTLVPVLRLVPAPDLKPFEKAVKTKIIDVWDRLDASDPTRQGIAELPEKEAEDGNPEVSYPPNAFLTYWAIRLLEEYARHGFAELSDEVEQKRTVAELWCQQTLGAQTARILGGAERTDPHQLAWALALELLHADEPATTAASPRLEVHRSALKAFFSKQEESGNWPLSAPLFHYPAAGNAYCYTFETLTALLRPALDEEKGVVARKLLQPHLPELLKAWHFAEETQIRIGPGAVGWCSGHHPHRLAPESWATASVFSYLQALRRLVGFWTSEEAGDALGARRSRWSAESGEEKLEERGRSWARGEHWTVGRQLAALFLHPLRSRLQSMPVIDPDQPLIPEQKDVDQARSAILYGPPGTGKTTLIEAIAGTVDWNYVEIHAADFLSEGMDKVPARADEIFAYLMELDRCVVLFDEIDELIRKRGGGESDPFNRFLTTSMLPKLARLWDQRRVLYFVATNDIDAADPAIRRSQRFDTTIFVAPPSFAVKKKLLDGDFKLPDDFNEENVNKSLEGGWSEENSLGVFALLRYDQVAVLAERLHKGGEGDKPSLETLKAALVDLGKELEQKEWKDEREPIDGDERGPYPLFRHLEQSEQRDSRMLQLLRADVSLPRPPQGTELFDTPEQGPSYFRIRGNLPDIQPEVDGRWKLKIDDLEAHDDYLLRFRQAGD